jgi:hypothetical protein
MVDCDNGRMLQEVKKVGFMFSGYVCMCARVRV